MKNHAKPKSRINNYILVVLISAAISSLVSLTFYEHFTGIGPRISTRFKPQTIPYVPSHLLRLRNGTFEYTCLKNAFRHVAVVVTFNFQFYKNIPILKELYKDVFGAVVFCGAASKDDNTNSKPDIVVDVGGGYFGYICMAKLIEKYPSFQGYLYINDDMIVNWWNFLTRDGNKVWQGPEIVDFTQDAYGPIVNAAWMWWNTEMGISACQNAYKELESRVANKNTEFDAKKALDIYLKNGDGKPRCGKGWSDFFYVPGSASKTCRYLLEINYKYQVFLEIAVNNMLQSLDDSKNFEMLKGIFLPDIGVTNSEDGRGIWEVYNTKITFLHPFKLGFETYAKMNHAILTNWILDMTKTLTNC